MGGLKKNWELAVVLMRNRFVLVTYLISLFLEGRGGGLLQEYVPSSPIERDLVNGGEGTGCHVDGDGSAVVG